MTIMAKFTFLAMFMGTKGFLPVSGDVVQSTTCSNIRLGYCGGSLFGSSVLLALEAIVGIHGIVALSKSAFSSFFFFVFCFLIGKGFSPRRRYNREVFPDLGAPIIIPRKVLPGLETIDEAGLVVDETVLVGDETVLVGDETC